MSETYDTLLEQLKVNRISVEAVKFEQKRRLDALQQSKEWQDFQLARVGYDQEISIIEGKIRTMAEVEFSDSGNKHPHEKIEVKIFRTFKIVDPARVLNWCKVNLSDALKIDEAKVKKYAVSIGAVEGTETGEEARVQIAQEL